MAGQGLFAMKKLLLAASLLAGFASGARAATPWPLAAFLDNPEDSGSESQYQDFTALMGTALSS
jgi:hypothetical protein